MKAKELAKKLLEHPEYNIYVDCKGRDLPLHDIEIIVNDFVETIYLGY